MREREVSEGLVNKKEERDREGGRGRKTEREGGRAGADTGGGGAVAPPPQAERT